MTRCRECGGCENIGEQPCPECQPAPGELSVGSWDDEPCMHDCGCAPTSTAVCTHQHCGNCGGCDCPGYCDDHATYNLRLTET
jgi:hypothetical protein